MSEEYAAKALLICLAKYGKGATDYAVDCHASGIR